MKLRSIILLLAFMALTRAILGQTVVIARPVSDVRGMAAFQVTKILRVEGEWEKPLVVGELIYAQKRERAHPIARFGEAIVIAFTESNNRYLWQGLHVHNGLIPALNGISVSELMSDLATRPMPPPTEPEPAQVQPAEPKGLCPICHQMHVHT